MNTKRQKDIMQKRNEIITKFQKEGCLSIEEINGKPIDSAYRGCTFEVVGKETHNLPQISEIRSGNKGIFRKMKIDVKIGQMIRGILIDGERPDHVNVKVPYAELKDLLYDDRGEGAKFWEWMEKAVFPATGFKGKTTIEITG